MIPVVPSNLHYSLTWLFTLTETTSVNKYLEKLVFDGNYLSYLCKDGDNSYVDHFKNLCSLVYLDNKLHKIPR